MPRAAALEDGAKRASVPARLPELALVPLTDGDDGLPGPVLYLLLPRMQAAPEIVRVDVEHVADVLEREEPGPIGILDPLLGLPKELPRARVLRSRLLAVDVDRILEDSDHQSPFSVVLASS